MHMSFWIPYFFKEGFLVYAFIAIYISVSISRGCCNIHRLIVGDLKRHSWYKCLVLLLFAALLYIINILCFRTFVDN